MSDITLANVLANPEEYGFTFVSSTVSKGTGAQKVALGIAPILTVQDFGKFEASFPGVLLKHSNGQSIRVHGQAITRGMLDKHDGTTVDAMKQAQIKGICFGQVATATVRTVTVEKIVTVEVTNEKRAQLIATLVDRGMSVADAQQIAATL
jgi:hypothetical protein